MSLTGCKRGTIGILKSDRLVRSDEVMGERKSSMRRVLYIGYLHVPSFMAKAASYVISLVRLKNPHTFGAVISPLADVASTCVIRNNTEVASDVKIGEYTFVNRGCSLNSVRIGKYSLIASNVRVYPSMHNINLPSVFHFSDSNLCPAYLRPRLRPREQIFKGMTIIGNDVWIGDDVKIMGGVTIGDGAVVAAGAIVTKNVEPYTIVGGIPAKVIKRRFEKRVSANLQDSRWWDMSPRLIRRNLLMFYDEDVENFVKKVRLLRGR